MGAGILRDGHSTCDEVDNPGYRIPPAEGGQLTGAVDVNRFDKKATADLLPKKIWHGRSAVPCENAVFAKIE